MTELGFEPRLQKEGWHAALNTEGVDRRGGSPWQPEQGKLCVGDPHRSGGGSGLSVEPAENLLPRLEWGSPWESSGGSARVVKRVGVWWEASIVWDNSTPARDQTEAGCTENSVVLWLLQAPLAVLSHCPPPRQGSDALGFLRQDCSSPPAPPPLPSTLSLALPRHAIPFLRIPSQPVLHLPPRASPPESAPSAAHSRPVLYASLVVL